MHDYVSYDRSATREDQNDDVVDKLGGREKNKLHKVFVPSSRKIRHLIRGTGTIL